VGSDVINKSLGFKNKGNLPCHLSTPGWLRGDNFGV